MAGAQLSMGVESASIRRALAGLVMSALSLREPFEEIGASLQASTQQRFEDEEDPEGNPWAELAPSTQASKVTRRATRGSDHILRDWGHLYASITYMASETDLAIGSNRIYAALHQLGGTDEMAPGPADVPARPFLGISDEDEREIEQILFDHLGSGLS